MLTQDMEILISRCDDPDLSAKQRRQLEQLLESDASAREYFQHLQSLDEHLASYGQQSADIDLAGFADAVNRKIDTAKSAQRQNLLRRFWIPLAAAAAIMLVALPWFNQISSPPAQTDSPKSSAVVLVQPQQIQAPQIAQVKLTPAPSEPKVSFVKLTLASQQIVPPVGSANGISEVICFSGPAVKTEPATKIKESNPNQYYLF